MPGFSARISRQFFGELMLKFRPGQTEIDNGSFKDVLDILRGGLGECIHSAVPCFDVLPDIINSSFGNTTFFTCGKRFNQDVTLEVAILVEVELEWG